MRNNKKEKSTSKDKPSQIVSATLLAQTFNADYELMLTAMQFYPNRTKPTWQKLIYEGATNGLTANQVLEQIITKGQPMGLIKRK